MFTARNADGRHRLRSCVLFGSVSASVLMAGLVPGAVAAQPVSEDATLQELIVTAQRREQRLIDVPIAITALSGQAIEERGIDNVQDLAFSVPSMAVQELGPGRQNITMRGVGGVKGVSSLIGVYVDEVSLAGLQDNFVTTYIDVRTTDLERVEVLKGPQGTLFGEGSVGGTLRFVTRDPNLSAFSGRATASVFGNADSQELSHEFTGVLNAPIVEGVFGIRAAVTYENQGGWIDRLGAVGGPVIQHDFNDNELLNIRVKGLLVPTEALRLEGMVIFHRSEGGGSNVVNTQPRKRSEFIIQFEPTAPTGFDDNYEIYNLTGTYDLGFAEFLSSTSYLETKSVASMAQRRRLLGTNPGFQEILMRDYAIYTDAFSQELRLASKGEGPLNWTVGAYYKDAKLARHWISGFDQVRFRQLTGQEIVGKGASAGLKPTTESTSWAVFADASWRLTDRLEIGGGVRYFEDEQTTYNALAANVAATILSGTFDATTYRAYASYEWAEGVKTYASVATGFRSGGFNTTDVVAEGRPASFGPENVISYELGAKMALADRRVGLEAAVFFSKYKDIQAQSTYTRPSGVLGAYISNPGAAELKGIEASINWAVTDRLTLSLAGDRIETEVTKIDPTVPVPPVLVGDPIDSVPEYSVQATAEYAFDWAADVPGRFLVQYSQQGHSTLTSRNAVGLIPQEHTPILNMLNASLSAEVRGWELEVFGRNLLDEAGELRAGNGLNPQARPRTLGVKVGRDF